ncbi:hypothetical protein SCUP234_11652 [Seiridium cupressi]
MSTLPILPGFVDIHLRPCLPIVSTLPIPQGFVPLSSNASISLLGSSAPVHSQNSSWLFRIPIELRRLVYGHLLGNDFEGIHFWLDASSKLAWSRCVGLDEVSQRHLSLPTHEGADEQGSRMPGSDSGPIASARPGVVIGNARSTDTKRTRLETS